MGIDHISFSVFADFRKTLLNDSACTGLGPLVQWVDFMNDRDVASQSGVCLEFPRVFAAMGATDSYVGKVSHKLRNDGVIITANHCFETRLRIRIESCPLILGKDTTPKGMFELDREARILLVVVEDQEIRLIAGVSRSPRVTSRLGSILQFA